MVSLVHLVRPLRQRRLGICPAIVLLSPTPPLPSEWDTISHYAQIYYVKGTPLSRPDLDRAGVRYGEWRHYYYVEAYGTRIIADV